MATLARLLDIKVNVFIELDERLREPLQRLVEELIAASGLESQSMVIAIFIIPDSAVGPAVNHLKGVDVYPEGSYVPTAVAVPSATDERLACSIFLAESLFSGMTYSYRPFGLVTSLLEELLHAKVYYSQWLQNNRFLDPLDHEHLSTDIIAARLHDEYVVCRTKAAIASTLPLFDIPGNPRVRSIATLSYGASVPDLVSASLAEIRVLKRLHGEGSLIVDEVIDRIEHIVFRGILDPLARSHAFQEGSVSADQTEVVLPPQTDPIYTQYVVQRWNLIHRRLQKSFDRDLKGFDDTAESIAHEVRLLVSDLDSYVRSSS